MEGTVVIVDDDMTFGRTMVNALTEEGVTARQVGTAAEALEVAAATPVAVYLVDMMLPDQSGIDVAAELRAEGGLAAPIIAMTSSFALAEMARESGVFTAVLEKPISVDDLLIAVMESVSAEE